MRLLKKLYHLNEYAKLVATATADMVKGPLDDMDFGRGAAGDVIAELAAAAAGGVLGVGQGAGKLTGQWGSVVQDDDIDGVSVVRGV